MKKKTLIILLIIPFIIGLLSFVSVILLNINVATNISRIDTPYNNDGEGFKISETPIRLEATPVINDPNAILRDGNNLIWEIEDKEDKKEIAEVTSSDNEIFYLNTYSEGEVTLVCHTENNGVSTRIRGIIYENGAIIVTPKYGSTGEQVNDIRNFGEYDISYNEVNKNNLYTKNKAEIEVNINVYGDNISNNDIKVEETSDNISFNDNKITINSYKDGKGYITLSAGYISDTYTFNIIKDAINVYSYDDLLMCTNFNSEGEKVVLQTSLSSLSDVYIGESIPISGDVGINQGAYYYKVDLPLTKKNPSRNVELFGNFDASNNKFNFNDELYYTETTYNHEFIDEYNKNNPDKEISDEIKVGIRVQKDFYGNGFTINMNNLCFPSNGSIDEVARKLIPGEEDYFKGPLSFVSISGELVGIDEIIKAFGQDNVGMYIDGDNITIDDLHIQNIDDNSNKRNYAYIGTVIDVNGNNNTIKNSIISLGKTLVRAFNSDNLLIDNSILTRSGEFNLKVGSDKYNKVIEYNEVNISSNEYRFNGSTKDFMNIDNYLEGLTANNILEKYLDVDMLGGGSNLNIDKTELNRLLYLVQDSLNNLDNIINSDGSVNYAQTININDTSFDDSGLFSIALETMFNGPYLYNGSSFTVKGAMNDLLGSPLPNNIGGTSLPSLVNISGDTRFYDWKKISDIDISNLISENLSYLASSVGMDIDLTIDSFFPVKPILKDKAKALGNIYNYENEEYINTAIAYYGGGINLSKINFNEEFNKEKILSEEIEVNLLEESERYLVSFGDGTVDKLITVLSKCVLFAAGFEPFKFVTNSKINSDTPYLFGKHPTVNTLKENLKK